MMLPKLAAYLHTNFVFFFEDLEASVTNLHKSGISNPSKTVISGMSAGGLAAAVLCNEMPQLIKAAVLQVS